MYDHTGKKAYRGGPQKPKFGVNQERFKKVALSKTTGKCHVCGDIRHYVRECKERKSGNNDVNVVDETTDMVAHVQMDDTTLIA